MEFRPNQITSQIASQLTATYVRVASACSVALLLGWATLFDRGSIPMISKVLDFSGSDKVGHLAIYAALTASVVWALGDHRTSKLGLPAWPVLIFGIGVMDELRQRGLNDRSFEVADLAANAIGIWAGWKLMVWMSKRVASR